MNYIIVLIILILSTLGLIYLSNMVGKIISGVILKIKNKKNKK